MDWQELSTLGTWAGVGLVFIGSTAAFLVSHGRTGKRLEVVEERVQKYEKELSEFRTTAAEKYVSVAVIERLEQRVFDAIKQVGDRIDGGLTRLGDRLDKVLDARSNQDHPK